MPSLMNDENRTQDTAVELLGGRGTKRKDMGSRATQSCFEPCLPALGSHKVREVRLKGRSGAAKVDSKTRPVLQAPSL